MNVSRREPTKRRIDRLLPGSGVPAAVYFATVVALLLLAPALPRRAELAADGLAALAAGTWCGVNFWRCRQAHCLVSAAGWLALSLVAFAGAGLGHSVIYGDEQLVFLGVLVAAFAFEGLWYVAKGSNVIRTSRGTAAPAPLGQWQPAWPQPHSWPPWAWCSLQ
jgi:hypothetical protein